MLHAACQQFLGKSEEEIRTVALETLVRYSKAEKMLLFLVKKKYFCTTLLSLVNDTIALFT